MRLDPSSLKALVGLAEVARSQFDYDLAEKLLSDALNREPQFVPALEGAVLLERSRQNWAQAAIWQSKRIAADPGSPPEAGQAARAMLAGLLVESVKFTELNGNVPHSSHLIPTTERRIKSWAIFFTDKVNGKKRGSN